MIRPGDLDAAPPLAPIVNGEKVKAPYNQQQFGGPAAGPSPRTSCSSSAATSGVANAAR